MRDHDIEIANLHVRISMLRKEERRLLLVISDQSTSYAGRLEARSDLQRIALQIVEMFHAIKKLEDEP
jgi:hypothetical protein